MEYGTDKNKPNYKSKAWHAMSGPIEICRDVRTGTLILREKAKHYLPNEPAEKTEHWEIRKRRAIFFNAFERTLHSLVGLVFRKEIEFGEDVPVQIAGVEAENETAEVEGWAENIDGKGAHLNVFAKEFFADVLGDGHAFIFVDMPPQLPEGATRADEIADPTRRPVFRKYLADQAINWRLDKNGLLEQITFEECTYEPDGEFGEKKVMKYRVIRRGEWILYKEIEGEDKAKTILEIDRGNITDPQGNPLPEIPVSVAYGRKVCDYESRPPLLDLAMINLCHFQKYSDYSTYLHIASRPILWFKGRDKAKAVQTVGAYTYFDAEQVAFAETSGSALGAAREDLQDLKDMMAILGLSILAQKTPKQTATETLIDHVKEESDLATAARSLKDCIERSLGFMAAYMGLPTGGSVDLGATMEELTLDADQIRAYSELAGRIFSTDTVRQIIVGALGDRLPEDYDDTREAGLLETEKTTAAQFAADLGARAMAQFDRGNGGGE